MGKVRAKPAKPTPKSKSRPLMVRLDAASKGTIGKAAKLRGISLSDYVRQVVGAQARKEVEAATSQTIVMTPDEQLTFWNALNQPVKLTPAQKRLGKLMRGES